jgi:hypothetical protein
MDISFLDPGLRALSEEFEYVHWQYLNTSIPESKWPMLCNDMYAVTAPGGWLELIEIEMQLQSVGPAGEELNRLFVKLGQKVGVDVFITNRLSQLLPAVGYVDVERTVVSLPCGDWGGYLGHLFMEDCMNSLEAVRACILELNLCSESALNALYNAWRAEANRTRCYGNIVIYRAYKPKNNTLDD